MDQLQNKVILITGSGSGLGAATAQSLAQAGAIVLAVDVKEESVQKVADQLTQAGHKAFAYKMDVGDEQNVREVLQTIVDKHGSLDAVINNAGIDVTKAVDKLEFHEWDRVMRVNLRGPFVVSKLAFEHMTKQNKGHIVNIVSTAAKRAWANASVYHASKWGLLGLSHALHVEGRQKNIKVTAVVAGGMKTPFILERFPEAEPNLQDPKNVADTIRYVLQQPDETVISEVMVLPMKETSWP